MHFCTRFVNRSQWTRKEGAGSFKPELTGSCEPQRGCSELIPGRLKEQQMLLAVQSSLQTCS